MLPLDYLPGIQKTGQYPQLEISSGAVLFILCVTKSPNSSTPSDDSRKWLLRAVLMLAASETNETKPRVRDSLNNGVVDGDLLCPSGRSQIVGRSVSG